MSGDQTEYDFSSKGLTSIPQSIFDAASVRHLYLNQNCLTTLPDEFFKLLPDLIWLDLRNNQLTHLPTIYLGRHSCLQCLLLQNNNLSGLPLELGLTYSGLLENLKTLSLSGNPIQFPPTAIVGAGTRAVLQYLADMLDEKTGASTGRKMRNVAESESQSGRSSTLSKSTVVSTKSSTKTDRSLESLAYRKQRERSALLNDTSSLSNGVRGLGERQHSVTPVEQNEELVDTPIAATFHRPASIHKSSPKQRTQPSGQFNIQLLQKQTRQGPNRRHIITRKKPNLYPPPPPEGIVSTKLQQKLFNDSEKELKIQIDHELQQIRDKNKLRQWRDDARKLQQAKYQEALDNPGGIDFVPPAVTAPFDFASSDLKTISNEERLKSRVLDKKQQKPEPLSPRSRVAIEQIRIQQDRILEERVMHHLHDMDERRKAGNLQFQSPQERLAIARKELKIATQLQEEVSRRRREMEFGMKGANTYKLQERLSEKMS